VVLTRAQLSMLLDLSGATGGCRDEGGGRSKLVETAGDRLLQGGSTAGLATTRIRGSDPLRACRSRPTTPRR
jgi:hypothetical protein